MKRMSKLLGCCPECGQRPQRRLVTFEEVVGPERAQAYRDEMRHHYESAARHRRRWQDVWSA